MFDRARLRQIVTDTEGCYEFQGLPRGNAIVVGTRPASRPVKKERELKESAIDRPAPFRPLRFLRGKTKKPDIQWPMTVESAAKGVQGRGAIREGVPAQGETRAEPAGCVTTRPAAPRSRRLLRSDPSSGRIQRNVIFLPETAHRPGSCLNRASARVDPFSWTLFGTGTET